MLAVRIRFILPCLLAAAAVAGCGSSKSSSSTTTSAAAAPSSSSTASTTSTSTATSSSAAPTAKAVVLTIKHDKKFGTILAAGHGRMTVYLWEADKGGKSHCTGACAATWPPLIGTATAVGHASAAHIGTTMRSDGQTQVTYNGHPLYLYAKDKDAGDAYGENSHSFGADWYVLTPSGNKVDKS